MPPHAQILPGTLDLLILKAVSLGPETADWNRLVAAIDAALRAEREEA